MAKVLFKRRTTAEIEDLEVEDGALIYNTDNGKTYMDFEEERIQTGGNADTIIARQTTEPTDEDIKLWINPDKVTPTGASNVVDSMGGNQTDKSPSVHAVKEYVTGIIESGTGYVKYADGTMICFYTQDITTSVSNAWGSTLYISNALTLNDFAQTFLATPCVQINVTGGASSAFVVNATASSTTNPGKIHLSRPQTDTSKTYTINVMAIGRWK